MVCYYFSCQVINAFLQWHFRDKIIFNMIFYNIFVPSGNLLQDEPGPSRYRPAVGGAGGGGGGGGAGYTKDELQVLK